VKVNADTNVLVRALVEDDKTQAARAKALLSSADEIVITLPTLCELVWTLTRSYRIAREEVADAIRDLVNSQTVVVDRRAVEAGLALFEAGEDFADGVVAHEGERLGANVFVSFDKRAVTKLKARGVATRLLA
jgi:predicted nucleic-acid-binding protein